MVDGREIRLKDVWPSDEEIDAVVKASVKPDQFRSVYNPMFAVRVEHGPKVEPLYDWRPQSTYIRRPPYWEGALAGERTLQGLRPLAVLPDNITTDHLSPSNAIMLNSAAGEYLAKMGCRRNFQFLREPSRRPSHPSAHLANRNCSTKCSNPDGGGSRFTARLERKEKSCAWGSDRTYMEREQP